MIDPNKVEWTPEEDKLLGQLVQNHGTSNWSMIAEFFPLRRGKQCRERWNNRLEGGIKKGQWTSQEDITIVSMQKAVGNHWALIAKLLPGRTDHMVKNRCKTLYRPKIYSSYLRDTIENLDTANPLSNELLTEALRLNNSELNHELDKYCTSVLEKTFSPVRVNHYGSLTGDAYVPAFCSRSLLLPTVYPMNLPEDTPPPPPPPPKSATTQPLNGLDILAEAVQVKSELQTVNECYYNSGIPLMVTTSNNSGVGSSSATVLPPMSAVSLCKPFLSKEDNPSTGDQSADAMDDDAAKLIGKRKRDESS